MNKLFIFLFLSILLLETAFHVFFPEITFTSNILVNANILIGIFSFFGLIFCLILLGKPPVLGKILMGIFILGLTYLTSCMAIYPIDSSTAPYDVVILKVEPDGKKEIIREEYNVKHDCLERDTALVKDYFIFRRVFWYSQAHYVS